MMITTIIITPYKEEREKIVSCIESQDDIKILACGNDGYDALKLSGNLKPQILVLENKLEFIEAGEIPPLLKIRSVFSSVVILTAKISDSELRRAAGNKVSGFVHKGKDMENLPMILRWVSRGGCFISPYLAGRVMHLISGNEAPAPGLPAGSLIDDPARNDPAGFLSKIELRILRRVGEGYSSNKIAENLGLTAGTVRNYISGIIHKTGLQNRAQLIRYAHSRGIVPLSA